MMEINTYNYYLRQVLGVENYTGLPQQLAAPSEPSVSVLSKPVDQRTLVVVSENTSEQERALLDKIMTAVGQQKNYMVCKSKDFDLQTHNFFEYVFMQPQFFRNHNDYEPFLLNDRKAVQVCRLGQMLPPSEASEIQKNKQLLWSSLKKIFGR